MTAYKNFIQDFPNRCKDVLEAFRVSASATDREVTLLITAATPCLLLPYGRLHEEKHPSQDRDNILNEASTFDIELSKECGKSCLLNGFKDEDWRYKKLNNLQGDPDAWGLKEDTKPISAKKTETIFNILRNAFAHGNIWTTGNPINTLVFVSLVDCQKTEGPFNTLQCSPQIFEQFIMNWVGFLNGLKLLC